MARARPAVDVRRVVVVVLASAALLGFAATYLIAPLNGNLRYEAGVKLVSPYSAAGTFSYRPLAFRLLMDGVFRLGRVLTGGTASFECAVRVLVALGAGAAGVLLWRGLLARRVRQPGLHAVVAVGAVLATGPISAGEPDWMAALLAIAGTGTALLARRRPWLWAGLTGVLLVGAAGMKVVTVVPALVGLGVVGLLDRRQLVRALVCTVAVGLLFVLATLVWVPQEVPWLLDIRTARLSWLDALPEAGPFFRQLATDRPVLVLLPAALVLGGWRERGATLAAVVLTAAAVLYQGEYFAYHSVPLLVVVSVSVFRGLRGLTSAALGVAVLGVVLTAGAAAGVPDEVLLSHRSAWTAVVLATAAVALAWAGVVRARPRVRRTAAPVLAALATLALLAPGATPWSARLLPPFGAHGAERLTTLEHRTEEETVARRVRQVVGGPDVPVTYLTFGEWVYFIQNPTGCRYPSPLFLQRTRFTDQVVGRPSYEDNLACLQTPGSRWLVWDPQWFALRRTPPQVQAVVARTWDCAARVDVGELRLCPRRG